MKKIFTTLLCLILASVLLCACGSDGEKTTANDHGDTEAPDTNAPETTVPVTEAPETDAPETVIPVTEAPETTAPETDPPEPIVFEFIDPAEAFEAEAQTLRFRKSNLVASSFDEKGEGNEVSYTGWVATPYVKLENCYGIYYNLAAHKKLMSVAFFDGDENYISGVGTNSMNIYATSVSGFAVLPENAAKARFLNFLGSDVIPAFEHAAVLVFETEEAFNAAKALYRYEGLKIACLGDSLTEGDYGPIRYTGGRSFENYPYYLAELTGAAVTNFGRCGASSSSYLKEYYDAGHIDITDSDVILLMLGTNLGLAPDSEYYADYCTLVDKILADKKPDAKLILITPPSATTNPDKINFGYMDNVLSANNAVLSIAESKGLPCIDALKTSPIQPEYEEKYQNFDGLHMNAEGYAEFARYIAGELAKILG